MARRLSDDNIDTRAAILDAAEELFGRRGFAGTSVRALAQRAGLNSALIFYYFGSKKGLYQLLLARYREQIEAALKRSLAAADSGHRAVIHALLDGYFDFMERHPGYGRVVVHQVAADETEAAAIAAMNQEAFIAIEALLGAPLQQRLGKHRVRHMLMTVVAVVSHYFMHTPLLHDIAPEGPPESDAARSGRRAHVHWLIDAMLDGAERQAAATSSTTTAPDRVEAPAPEPTPSPDDEAAPPQP